MSFVCLQLVGQIAEFFSRITSHSVSQHALLTGLQLYTIP